MKELQELAFLETKSLLNYGNDFASNGVSMAGDKTANAGTTEGFAEFLTRKGFNLYKSGTMENQGDVDTYEGRW